MFKKAVHKSVCFALHTIVFPAKSVYEFIYCMELYSSVIPGIVTNSIF